jgi:Uma2 family endonuclease
VIGILYEMYKDRPDVFATGGGFIFYDASNGNRRIAPDFLIVFDVDAVYIQETLPNYLIWEIGKPPHFVMEVASPSTATNDLGRKRELYERLGVQEYWRFDHKGGELYGQPLAGDRLVDGVYQPYEIHADEDGSLRGYSELLGLVFYWDGYEFDVLDPETGMTMHKITVAGRSPYRSRRNARRGCRSARARPAGGKRPSASTAALITARGARSAAFRFYRHSERLIPVIPNENEEASVLNSQAGLS